MRVQCILTVLWVSWLAGNGKKIPPSPAIRHETARTFKYAYDMIYEENRG